VFVFWMLLAVVGSVSHRIVLVAYRATHQ